MEQNSGGASPGKTGRGAQLRLIGAGVLVVGAVAYLIWASLPQGTVYYQTVQELHRQAVDRQPVRVAGTVAAGSIQRNIQAARLQFDVLDSGDRLPVVYHGVVPDIFGPNIEVVVEGRRDSTGVFQAQTLLAKCPSRFQSAAVAPPGGPAP